MDQTSVVLEYLKAHIFLSIIPLCFFTFLWILIAKQRKQRRQQEEMRQLQRRDEALTKALRNPRGGHVSSGRMGPVEVAWDEQAADSGQKHHAVLMMELVERSDYARRKYVFRAEESVTVGSGGDNRLLLSREGVAEQHCVFFMWGKRPCVRTLPGAKTMLKRGKETAIVSEQGVYLNNGDHIQVGNADIQFRLFKA